ncbi:MAG TPA: CRTAC1 family protein [Kofleriaceae bacterium]|nr:CRTAC1 family protein [Kofleriaceae bacterium]
MRWLGLVGAAALAACGSEPDPRGGTCVDPPRGPDMTRLADVTAESGVDFVYENPLFQGGGLAVADLDGDDLPELVATRRRGGAMVFHNLGGMRFAPRPDSGVPSDLAANAIAAADLDNDGDRELVLATFDATVVFANDGAGGFREVVRFADSGTTEHVLPVDLDGDGLLDLYLSNYDLRDEVKTQNRVLMNRGGLAFAPAVVGGAGLSWTATAFDVDDDGDQDLYIANDTLLADYGTGELSGPVLYPVDLFLRNDGPGADGAPVFTDIAEELGLTRPRSSMGGVLHDFDDDGRLDLYVPDLGADKVFVRDANGGFVDRAPELGLAATERVNKYCEGPARTEECLVMSWSGAIVDFDLDGDDELLVVNGETTPFDIPPVTMFARDGALPYRELSPTLPCMDARAQVATDLDGDGDQDLAIAYVNGPLAIFEDRGTPAPSAWLRVVLRGSTSNRDGLGAVVTVRTTRRTVQRVVGHGGVVHASLPAEAHVGLGADVVEAVEVRWPSGTRSELTGPLTGTVVVDEMR